MKFKCKHIDLSIVIDDKLMDELCRIGSEHYPKEYGGLFVGRYINENTELLIENTILPKKFRSSALSFERGVEGLRETLQQFFNQSPSLIYVGEWHTHPNGNPIPSSTDSSALRTIASHHEVSIENPTLLIIGIAREVYKFGFYVLYKDGIHRYELEKNEANVNVSAN